MVAGKPATNSLLLTNQQTGTVMPGGSVDVSFSFHATSVGRWTHDLAVRNLGNKHDQVRETTTKTKKGSRSASLCCVCVFFCCAAQNGFVDANGRVRQCGCLAGCRSVLALRGKTRDSARCEHFSAK